MAELQEEVKDFCRPNVSHDEDIDWSSVPDSELAVLAGIKLSGLQYPREMPQSTAWPKVKVLPGRLCSPNELMMQQELPFEVPCIVNGILVRTGRLAKQPIPSDHARYLCTYHEADESTVASAIDGALSAEAEWGAMPWNDCDAILLRAAELVSGKYRYKLVTATMFDQGKNAWQAEIDAAAEVFDRWIFRSSRTSSGVKHVEELYAQQPPKNSAGSWNRVEYRSLQGFILAVSPSNFTAIGGNLPGETCTCTGFHIFQLLGLRDSCGGWRPIQFILGLPPEVVAPAISHPSFIALHFTGSTFVFQKLWKDITAYLNKYRGYLRMRQEGKNFYFLQGTRGSCEDQGQKCYALSRLYVSSSVWSPGFKDLLLSEVAKIKVGSPSDFSNFMGLIIGRLTYDKIMGFVQKAKDAGGEVLIGGHRFAADHKALLTATKNKLRDTAGNIYYNEKCAGAVMGQQPYGGARASGTNDKAGTSSTGSFRQEA
ncbi:Aldehyde/histidinol dehydrogenase [Suillus lakei]|nr:Aldehyde/histidinol dehydrogenase [Suillus lakei]